MDSEKYEPTATGHAQSGSGILIAIPFYKNEHLVELVVGSLINCASDLAAIGAQVVLYDDSPFYKPLRAALEAILPAAQAAFPCRLVLNPENLGFVRTMNLAVADAVEHRLHLLLLNSDFTAARDVADAINKEFGKVIAHALDSRRIDVSVAESGTASVPILISRIQNLSINFRSPAKVVVNERTGTIVMGGDVRLSPVSVIHGSLTIDVRTTQVVSQPASYSNGKTEVTTETKLTVNDAPAQSIQLEEGANVDELIKGLHAIGATSHDIIAILQAIKAAGGLQADLEVI